MPPSDDRRLLGTTAAMFLIPPWPPTKIFFYARLVYVKDLVSFARLPAGPKEGVEAVRRGRRT
jgi:hypothetical protein